MSRITYRVSRIVRPFIFLLFATSYLLPASSASAANVMFSCWCQDTTTRTCNHHLIDSGIAEGSSELTSAGLAVAPISIAGSAVLMLAGGVETSVEDLLNGPALASQREALRDRCRDRCQEDGNRRAIHFETRYREEICEECNADPDSSCTEERGARLAFGDAQEEELIAACEERRSQSLLPMTLAVPIGGITQVAGLPDYINVAYRYLVTVVLVVAIVMVVYGGFRYLVGASIGDIQAGKKIIVDAIVGMLIVLGAYTILSTINPATTILSFTPPEPIECRDISLPEAVKNSRCASDRDCASGMRCVEAVNYIFSFQNVVEAQAEGSETGAEAAGDFIGSGKTAGLIGLATHPLGLLSLFTESTEARRARGVAVTEAVGGVAGGAIARDITIATELRQDASNIHLCSTGEQGAPCLETQSCRAGLRCMESWGICWSDSGNQPGQPCDSDAHCSNGSCVDVSGTDFKVCEIEVRDSTPCFRPDNGNSATGFPIQCNGVPGPGDFTCAWCPSGARGEERVWTYLSQGTIFSAQCKPRDVLGQPCAP